MIEAIIITFAITVLSMSILILLNGVRQRSKECRRLRQTNDGLGKQIAYYRMQEQELRERNAYNSGVYISKYIEQDKLSGMINETRTTA